MENVFRAKDKAHPLLRQSYHARRRLRHNEPSSGRQHVGKHKWNHEKSIADGRGCGGSSVDGGKDLVSESLVEEDGCETGLADFAHQRTIVHRSEGPSVSYPFRDSQRSSNMQLSKTFAVVDYVMAGCIKVGMVQLNLELDFLFWKLGFHHEASPFLVSMKWLT